MTTENNTENNRIALILKHLSLDHKNLHAFASHLLSDNNDQLDLFPDDQACAQIIEKFFAAIQKRPKGKEVSSFVSSAMENKGNELQALVLADCNHAFIVETVKMLMAKQKLSLMLSMNVIFVIVRDAKGNMQSLEPFVGQNVSPEQVESLSINVLRDYISSDHQKEFLGVIADTFIDIRRVHNDWQEMMDAAGGAARRIANNSQLAETVREQEVAFINWLIEEHFTFLGMRKTDYASESFDIKVDWAESLGLLRNESYRIFGGQENAGNVKKATLAILKCRETSIRIFKTPFHSTVRRDAVLDVVLIKRYDNNGQCIGDLTFVGFFAWAAYAEPIKDVPLAKSKAQYVMEKNHALKRSYRGRQLLHMIEYYSRDMLFQVDSETLLQHIELMRLVHRRNEAQVWHYSCALSTGVYFSLAILRENYSINLREDIVLFLKNFFDVKNVDYGVHLPDSAIWRIDFRLFLEGGRPLPTNKEISQARAVMLELAQSNTDKLRASLQKHYSLQHVSRLLDKYASAFDDKYWSRNDEAFALLDIQCIEQMIADGQKIRVNLKKTKAGWQVRLYNLRNKRVYLSEIMPMLENMGMTVHFEEPFILNLPENSRTGVLAFSVAHPSLGAGVAPETITHFDDCLTALFDKKTEVDGFLKLVIAVGLPWRDVMVLRAYAKYLKQIGFPIYSGVIAETLAQYPEITKNLIDLFHERFHPTRHDPKKADKTLAAINASLGEVSNLDQDRLLNRYKVLISATLRTNFFQLDEQQNPREAICLKLAPREIEGMPEPVPLREIFVYSPHFEAVHLRFGLVSRGGLRWSDRNEDFRTEILGLVKAQQVKNAVIVPMGSKGGFVLKNTMPDRQSFIEEGIKRYRQFISSMLQISDSYLPNAQIRKPVDVVCHDADDPYLVVAADKGTATFSDFANEESEKADFWLGDAFASGGSKGYDHKKMGITARGGWESVKRHFREMGHNTQTMPFNVVGVGDMSGDVFGNGMLLSEQIRLIGAFNHLHIFVDPDPDPATSFKERQRLFEMPRSDWTDYSEKVMSKGGRIFERNAKSLTLTTEIQSALGLDTDAIAPNDLIRHLLCMSSDLLWFGGIGTYIKSKSESHADVGDKANDAIRISAHEVGAKVIGEGANLGVTQLGRIEFSEAGGRINTDAIDNSAGVDCSDHEVNIKILLNSAVSEGSLKAKDRDGLLESMTDEVAELVLKNNYAQTLSLSVVEANASRLLDMHQRVMANFERAGHLNRQLEGLPDDDEIERRRGLGLGLYRPELSVLMAYAKNIIYQGLQDSKIVDDPMLQDYLFEYFPSALRERFADEIANHQLRREIIATVMTNRLINRGGVGFVSELSDLTGAPREQACLSFMAVSEIFNLPSIWSQVEALDNIAPSAMQHKMILETIFTIRRIMEWVLLNVPQPMDFRQCVERYGTGLRELSGFIEQILSPEALALVRKRQGTFEDPSIPQTLSMQVGQLKVLSSVCDIVDLAEKSRQSLRLTALTYFAVSDRLALDYIRSMANAVQSQDVWVAQALSVAINDLWSLQSEITLRALKLNKGEDSLRIWLENKAEVMAKLDLQYHELFQRRQITVAMLSVLQRQLQLLL